MARITDATGLGKGSLYHAFPGGKKEMADVVLAKVHAWFEANVFEPLDEDIDPAQSIASMFRNVDLYFQSGGRICLLGSFALSRSGNLFAEQIDGYFKRWITALAGALDRHGLKDANATATMIVASIQGGLVASAALQDVDVFAIVIRKLTVFCKSEVG